MEVVLSTLIEIALFLFMVVGLILMPITFLASRKAQIKEHREFKEGLTEINELSSRLEVFIAEEKVREEKQ